MNNYLHQTPQEEEISNFLKKHHVALHSQENTLSRNDYIYLQYICNSVKKNHTLLRKLSTKDLDLLTTNTCYQIKGLTLPLAQAFIYKKAYHIFRDSLLKQNQSWMDSPTTANIFYICMKEHSYSNSEIDTIVDTLWEYKRKDQYNGFKTLTKEDVFHNSQLVDVLIRVLEKMPEKMKSDPYNYEHGTQKVLKHITSSIFYMNEELTDKFISHIPHLNEDALVFLVKQSETLVHHYNSYFSWQNYMLDVEEQTEKYYNRFPFPQKAKELMQCLIEQWERVTSPYFTKTPIEENFGYSLSHSNMSLFNNSLKIKLFYDLSSYSMQKLLVARAVYNYCDRTDSNSLFNIPSIPRPWEIDILQRDDGETNYLQILNKTFKMRMPEKHSANMKILFHFVNPEQYPLNQEQKRDLINSIAETFNNEDLDTATDYFIQHLGFSFFHDELLENNQITNKMVTIAMEKELLATIPKQSTNKKSLKF